MPIQLPTVQTGFEASVDAARRKIGAIKLDVSLDSKPIIDLSRPLGKLTGQADQFTQSMGAANARVLAFGASVGVLSAVTAGFNQIITTTIKVEKSLADINSVLQTNSANLNKFKNDIFSVAKETGNSFDTVSQAALELSRQGLKSDEVLRRLKDSMILSRLSGLDAASAVEGLTAAVNSFSKEGVTTSDVLNKISKTAAAFSVSERDLIEGFKRSASVAQQAGVSLDELGGIITAVQQKTARGGAVIGNAFKTIFTRIQRPDSLRALRDIGAEITDAQGGILPATKLIENLAGKIKGLNDVEVASITEKIGGGFQVGPLIAALDDLTSKTSTFKGATEAMATASNEAYKRNTALNITLESAINNTTVSLQELANTLGEIGVTDSLKNILSFFNSFTANVKDVLQGEGLGSDFAKGLVKGISAVLSGPGLLLFGVIIGKLVLNFVQFGASAVKTFFNIGSAAKQIKEIESGIVSTLLNNKSIQTQILALEGNRVAQSQLFSTSLNTQLATMEKMKGIAASIAPDVFMATTGSKKRKSGNAGGYIPSSAGGYMPTVMAEANDISKGVGGARPSDRPVVIPNFAFGGGKTGTMVAHTGEHIVPNYNGGSGSAIFNRDMVGRMGLPSGAQKIRGAGGFIPNFAGVRGESKKDFRESLILTPEEKKLVELLGTRIDLRDRDELLKNRVFKDYGTDNSGRPTESGTKIKTLLLNKISSKQGIIKEKKESSTLFIDADANLGGIGVVSIVGPNKATVTENITGGSFVGKAKNFVDDTYGEDEYSSIQMSNIKLRNLNNLKPEEGKKDFRAKVKERFATPLYQLAGDILPNVFNGKKAADYSAQLKADPALFSDSVLGGIFESAVRMSTTAVANMQSFNDSDDQAPFDFEGDANSEAFKKAFGFEGNLFRADAKQTATEGTGKNISSVISKALRNPGTQGKIIAAKLGTARPAASGYIPNFVDQKYVMETLGRIKSGTSGFSKQEQETFLKKFGATGGTGKGISLKQVFDDLDSDPSVSPFINKAYGAAGATASTSQVFKEFERQTKANPTQLRNVVKGKGFIPNFVSKSRELGRGIQGVFYKLGEKDGTQVGVKKFYKDGPSKAIEAEWLVAEFISKYAKIPSVFGPKNLSTLEDSKRKLSIRKEIVSDSLAKTVLGSQVSNAFGSSVLFNALGARGLSIGDLHGSNYTVNKNAENAINELKNYPQNPTGAFSTLRSMASSGAKIGILDPGDAKVSGIARDIIGKIIAAQPKQKNAAGGYIPNFADSGNQGQRITPAQIAKGLGAALVKILVDQYLGDGVLDAIEASGLKSLKGSDIKAFAGELQKPTKSKHKRAFERALMSDAGMQRQFPQYYSRLLSESSDSASGGFIPNFANPLNEAISREIGAGVNPSQVYIDQSNSLKGPMNPSGLMVANRRDEPSGGWQGINRARKEGANAKTYGAANGFIPNYAAQIGQVTRSDLGKTQINDQAVVGFNNSLKAISDQLRKGAISFTEANSQVNQLATVTGKTKAQINKLQASGQNLITGYDNELQARNQKAKELRSQRSESRTARSMAELSGTANSAASGPDPLEKPKRDFLGTIFAVQAGLTLLSGATEGATNSLEKYTNIISGGIGTATSTLFAFQGLSSLLPKFAGFLGPAGVAVSTLTAAWQVGTAIYNEQAGVNKIVAQSLSNVADAASKASINLASLSKGEQSDIKKKAEASVMQALETSEMVNASQSNDFWTRFAATVSSGGSLTGSRGTLPSETQVKQTARFDTDVTGALKQNLFDLQAEALGAGVPLEKLQGKIKEFAGDSVITQFEILMLSQSFSSFIDEIKKTDKALKELNLNPLNGIGASIAGMTIEDVKKFIDPQKNMTVEERALMAGYSKGPQQQTQYKTGQDGKAYAFTPKALEAYNKNPLKIVKDELKKTMGEGPPLDKKLLEEATKLINLLAVKTDEAADQVIAINQEYATLLLNLKAQQAFKDKILELDDSSLNSQIVLQQRITGIMNDQSLSEEDRLKAIKRLELSNKETLSDLKLQEQKLIDIQTLVNDLSKSDLFEFDISTNPLMAENLKSSFANATKYLSPEKIENLTDLTLLARQSLTSAGIKQESQGFDAKVGQAAIFLKQTLDTQVQLNREKEKENKLNRSNLTEEEKRLENTKSLEKAFLKVKNAADIKNLSTSLTNIGLQGQSARVDIEKQMELANPKTFAGVTDPREYLAIQQKIEFDAFERKRKLDLEIQVNQIKMEAEREATTIENITALGQNTEAINNWIDSQLTAQANAAALAPLDNATGGGSINDIIAKQVKEQGLTSKFTNKEQNLKYLGSETATDENVIQFLKNLAYKESSFNPSTTYQENFNDSSGQPVISTGLFGISKESAHGYGNYAATNENLKNPEYNTKVAVDIMGELLTESKGIIAQKTQNGYAGASAYWGPLRKGASDTTSIDLSGQTEQLRSEVSKQVEAISKLDPKQMQAAAEKFAIGLYGAGDQASKFAGMISSKAGQIKEASASSQQNRETERQKLQAERQAQAPKTFSQGMDAAFLNINGQLLNFSYEMGERIPQSFADNMASAMEGVIMQGESLGDSLRSAATSFLNEITKANIKNFASTLTSGIGGGIGTLFRANGGPITGGSGSKDDVPAMLMGGEYVMNKKAVSKYGTTFMEALNNGSVSGFADGGSVIRSRGLATDVINSSNVGDQTGEGGFQMPGYYGSGAITGKKDLLGYASQAYTSGAGDIIGGGNDSAYIDLTPESVRLTNFGRNQGPMAAAVRESKEQSLDLYFQQLAAEKQAKEEEKAQKKAFKKAIINALITSAVGSVVGAGAAGFKAGVMGAGKDANFGQTLMAGGKGIVTGGDIGGGVMAGGLKNLFSGNYQLSQTSDLKGYQQYLTSNPKELEKFLGGSASRSITGPNGGVLNAWSHAGTANSALKYIPTRATGGSIPQTSGIDTVPAMLSGGEFIMNAGATQRIGASNLNAMNSGASTETSSSAINDQLINKIDELIRVTKESSKPVTVNVSSQQGQSGGDNQGEENKSEKDQNLSRKIKAAVVQVLQEEKRLGGVLRRS